MYIRSLISLGFILLLIYLSYRVAVCVKNKLSRVKEKLKCNSVSRSEKRRALDNFDAYLKRMQQKNE
ncbi:MULTISPECIES: hypothetical protein [unclassified Borrelia]|uniref:hypothetical protein n=1 Tax=unclassified Borrelia TaxID=2649934 RepID=UPI001E533E21|nr:MULTISPECIES: hypothetical protein [unclassified Borrelia]UGQ16818.1 hypothetical protein LSO06_05705 [Borrelia sp. RT5S]UGQ17961.1 hypothetical protein LSO05_05875 [Borrelia sp. RT1S]